MFVLDEVKSYFIQVVAELFQQLGTDNDSFEHDTAWTDFAKEDKVGFAFSCVDLFFQKFDFFIKQKVLLLEVDILLILFSILKSGELILKFFQIISNVVVAHITIRSQSLKIVFTSL